MVQPREDLQKCKKGEGEEVLDHVKEEGNFIQIEEFLDFKSQLGSLRPTSSSSPRLSWLAGVLWTASIS
ncbi:hypothetical protein LINPERHAP2_LOCUS42016, partial [Linum perenne]